MINSERIAVQIFGVKFCINLKLCIATTTLKWIKITERVKP